jgi:multidrug efflux system membrane fusion protein
VRAKFDNADGALIPGLYARVKVGGGAPHPALLIDDAAVGTDQDKKFVLIVDHGNHVVYREISTGAMQGNLRVVKDGLKPGDRIVVNGIQRVRPGDTVRAHMVPMTTDDDPNSAALAQSRAKADAGAKGNS